MARRGSIIDWLISNITAIRAHASPNMGRPLDQALQPSTRRAAIKINFIPTKSQFNGDNKSADYLDRVGSRRSLPQHRFGAVKGKSTSRSFYQEAIHGT